MEQPLLNLLLEEIATLKAENAALKERVKNLPVPPYYQNNLNGDTKIELVRLKERFKDYL